MKKFLDRYLFSRLGLQILFSVLVILMIPSISRHPYLVGIPVGVAMLGWLVFLVCLEAEQISDF